MTGTVLFSLAWCLCMLLTARIVIYYHKRQGLMGRRFGLLIAAGFILTWFLAFLGPFLATNARLPGNATIFLGIALSTATGVLVYLAARIYFASKRQGK